MSLEQRSLELREQWLNKVKCESSFLDAVYFIYYYNFEIASGGPHPRPSEITPQEVFLQFDEVKYNDCLQMAKSLLHKTSYVGASHWNYKDALPYEDAIARMKQEHPGFNETSYNLAARKSASEMKW